MMPKHRRAPWIPQKVTQGGRHQDNSFYQSAAWRKLSKAFKAAHPLCAECERQGRVMAADVADHIIPISQGADPLDAENLQALCHPHHNQKSGTERDPQKPAR